MAVARRAGNGLVADELGVEVLEQIAGVPVKS